MVSILFNVLTVGCVLGAAFLGIYLFQLLREQQRMSRRQAYKRRLVSLRSRIEVDPPRPGVRQPPKTIQTQSPITQPPKTFEIPRLLRNQFCPHLQKRLLSLVNGDVRTAQRLVSQVRVTNPARSEDWCLEKVIYDLERDRH